MTGAAPTPPGDLRVAWLQTRVLLIRTRNRLLAASKQKAAKRQGTARKRTEGVATLTLTSLAMLAAFTNLGYQVFGALERSTTGLNAAEFGLHTAFGGPLALAMTLAACIYLAAAFVLTLGSKELAQPDWDLEWLVTMPVRIPVLLATRALGRALVNPTGFLTLGLFAAVVTFQQRDPWWSVPVALALTMPLLLAIGGTHGLVDAWLRLRLDPSRLRNLQAMLAISATVLWFVGMSPMMSPKDAWLAKAAQWLPGLVAWTPPGLYVAALGATDRTQALLRTGLLWLECGAIAWASLAALRVTIAGGLVATGVRERATPRSAGSAGNSRGSTLLGPIERRELRLLGRDRNFLVQTTVLPVLIVGMQLFFAVDGLRGFTADAPKLATTAFGVAAYALMFSAFQTLNAEGHALWLLFTFPRPVDWVLMRKARLWAVVSLAYPAAVLSLGLASGLAPSWDLLAQALLVFAGIPIYASIATSLGVFACDPLATEVQKRVRPDYMYLYMTLASVYGFAIYASSPWQRIGAVTLVALLSLALWQKARDRLPYLLDPTAAPPASVSVADGMIAAVFFFFVQSVVFVILALVHEGKALATDLTIAFSVAGLLTWGLARYFFWRSKSAGVPRLFASGVIRSLAVGVGLGAVAAVFGAGYLRALAAWPDLFEHAPSNSADLLSSPWFIAMVVVAAPLTEEFIFRGLVFGGLRRTLGLVPSLLASAGIFAIVHPPTSVVPVFVLGLCAAFAYELTGALVAPIVAHGLYNAIVVWLQP